MAETEHESMSEAEREERLERRPVELTPEQRQRREAALGHLSLWGDPILRTTTRQVTTFDASLRQEVARMTELMEDAIGCGLAAPQVGSLKRMFVYQAEREGPVCAVLNPVITWTSEEEESDFEGCLSIPDVIIEVPRPVEVRVEAQTIDGTPWVIEAEGFEARVIQHEYDHLEGVLILDRATREDRREALRQLSGSSPVDSRA